MKITLHGKLLILLLLAPLSVLAQEETPPKYSFNGYVKYMQSSFLINQNLLNLYSDHLIHNRLNFKWYPTDKITGSVELRNRAFYGEFTKLQPQLGDRLEEDAGSVDMSFSLINDSIFVLHSMVDRANLVYMDNKWAVRIGRQRINWGINLAWNPNDLFNAFNFFDFDYEERPGTDAMRIQYYTGDLSNIDFAVSPGKGEDDRTWALRYGTNYKGYDLQLIGAWFKQDYVLGLGWAGNIKTAGFKGELSYFLPRDELLRDSMDNLSASITVDYTFPGGWYVAASFLYQSQGTTDELVQGPGIGLASGTPSVKALMPTRYNAFLMVSKPLNPVSSVSLSTIYGAGTNLFIIFPTYTYSLKENWDIDFVAQAALIEQKKRLRNSGSAFFLRLKRSF